LFKNPFTQEALETFNQEFEAMGALADVEAALAASGADPAINTLPLDFDPDASQAADLATLAVATDDPESDTLPLDFGLDASQAAELTSATLSAASADPGSTITLPSDPGLGASQAADPLAGIDIGLVDLTELSDDTIGEADPKDGGLSELLGELQASLSTSEQQLHAREVFMPPHPDLASDASQNPSTSTEFASYSVSLEELDLDLSGFMLDDSSSHETFEDRHVPTCL